MLKELKITDFAIIDNLTIPFSAGLNVLTGETGAGKSIIVQALGLVAGDRPPADVVRAGAVEASVTAVFDISSFKPEIISELKKAGYEVGQNLNIKRSISQSGRSRIYINDIPAAQAILKRLNPHLVEISSQHEHQMLLDEKTHCEIVDRFANLDWLCEAYSSAFDRYTRMKERVDEIEKLIASAVEQKEFITYQVREIDSLGLTPGEDEELARERNIARHGAKLLKNLQFVDEMLYSSEESVAGAMGRILSALSAAAEIDPALKEMASACDQARVAIEELSRRVNSYLGSVDINLDRLEEIETRLYDIERLKKKHGTTIDGILKKRDELFLKLNVIENAGVEMEKANEELASAWVEMKKLAVKLSRERAKAALQLAGHVQAELASLGLEKTSFMPGHIVLDIEQADASGIDRFGFLISPNPGEPLKPLAKIASGGELSRIMLAIKRVLMDKVNHAAVEVFDEVDVGIGGAVAEMVGRKLKEMSAVRQVISITHLPQVACLADNHIAVRKCERGGRTVTRFEKLSSDARMLEIARMLGGRKITEAAVAHARDMLAR